MDGFHLSYAITSWNNIHFSLNLCCSQWHMNFNSISHWLLTLYWLYRCVFFDLLTFESWVMNYLEFVPFPIFCDCITYFMIWGYKYVFNFIFFDDCNHCTILMILDVFIVTVWPFKTDLWMVFIKIMLQFHESSFIS